MRIEPQLGRHAEMAADYMDDFDYYGETRRGPGRTSVVAVAVVLAMAGVGYGVWRRRGGQQIPGRWVRALSSQVPRSLKNGEAIEALRTRMADAIRPRPVGHPVRSALFRIATAALSAAVAAFAKYGVRHLMNGRPRQSGPAQTSATG